MTEQAAAARPQNERDLPDHQVVKKRPHTRDDSHASRGMSWISANSIGPLARHDVACRVVLARYCGATK